MIANDESITRSWLAMPICTWPLTNRGAALGVEGDEVRGSTFLSRREVFSPDAMLQKITEVAAAAGCIGTTDPAPSAGHGAPRRWHGRVACGSLRACRASNRCLVHSIPASTTIRPRRDRTSRRSVSSTGRPARPTSCNPWEGRPNRCRCRRISPGRHLCW